jgi:hypothetical protein
MKSVAPEGNCSRVASATLREPFQAAEHHIGPEQGGVDEREAEFRASCAHSSTETMET